MNIIIYMRNELNKNEKRVPIIPNDIPVLINNNFKIYIQSSFTRIYKDNEYEEKGAIITNLLWYNEKFQNALIIGLKELDNLTKLDQHQHVYFAHCYKKQNNSSIILNAFKNSNSILYDFEYFLNYNKNFNIENKIHRIISFGVYAGISGSAIGLSQYYNYWNEEKDIKNLEFYDEKDMLIRDLQRINEAEFGAREKIQNNFKNMPIPKIVIIGPGGNCGKGVQYILQIINLKYDILSSDNNINFELLKKYDIIFNCILLDKNYNNIWFNDENINEIQHDLLIVDVSCDNEKINNPIRLNYPNTTFKEPVFNINNFIKIIAISNLPSYLPKNSSINFSNKFIKLLLNYQKNKDHDDWKKNKEIYYKILESI